MNISPRDSLSGQFTAEPWPRGFLFCILLSGVILLSGFLVPADDAFSSSPPQSADLTVCVSILPQAFFVERIGNERVAVEVLVGPGESPASYDPPARQLVRLAKARAYFFIGVPMENRILPHIRQNFPQVAIVDTRAGIDLFSQPNDLADHENHTDHDEAADQKNHGNHDPHVWLSPRRAQIMAWNICQGLIAIDPSHDAVYLANCTKLTAELEELDREIRGILAPVAGKEMFVFHPAYGYFAADFGLKQVAIEMGGLAPSPHHLASVLELAREQGVGTIFVQPQFSASAAQAVAVATGVELTVLDPLRRDYLTNLREMSLKIRQALSSE